MYTDDPRPPAPEGSPYHQQRMNEPQPTQQVPRPSETAPAGSSYGAGGAASGSTAQQPQPQYQPQHQPRPQQPVAQPPRKPHSFLWALLGGAICSGALFLILWLTGFISGPTVVSDPGPTGGQAISIDADDEDLTVAEVVSAKCLPSVGSLIVTATDGTYSGSGVLLDEDGYMLTNSHVIEGAQAISCTIDDKSYQAEVVGADPSSDLAVIKVDFQGDAHTPIEVGSSADVEVGEWVMAIGSPFGYDLSVSTGIVSSLYHSTILTSQNGNKIYTNLIQTDAAINPGNSGGALVNERGQLVGINSIISSYSGSSSGVGFAIPSDYAIGVAAALINGEEVPHAYIGTNVRTVNAQIASMNQLPVSQGAYVISVVQDGPAAQAGLQEGDIITAIGDTPVNSADGLILAVRSRLIGEKTTITYWRGNEEHTVDITLGSDLEAKADDTSEDDAYGQNVAPDTGQGTAPDTGQNGQQLELSPEQLQELLGQLFQ